MIGPNIKKNYELKYNIHNLDVPPTILKILGLKPNKLWRGRVVREAFKPKLRVIFFFFIKNNKIH